MRRKRTTECVTSNEMTLGEFYGAILLYRNRNGYFSDLLIKIVRIGVFEYDCDKQIITWDVWLLPFVSTLDHYQLSS